MRIVGGRFRGRALEAPTDRDLRPTADRVRESIFNVLAHGVDGFDFDGLTVLDVFAGTGALGLEAMSRGCGHGVFIDSAPSAQALTRKNAGALGLGRAVTLLKLDATRLPPPPRIAKTPAGLVFLDPPYEKGLVAPALKGLVNKGWIKQGCVCVVEVAAKEEFDPPREFKILDERTYGAARVIFLAL